MSATSRKPSVVRALDELWRHQVVRVQAGERWDFSHDRIREVAYEALGPARRRLIHRRIARALERLSARRSRRRERRIAVHLDRGGQPLRAIPFLERAAEVATRVSATEETVRCFTYALSLVGALPAARDRDERELAIRGAMSASLTSARGYAAPEVQSNLERIVALGAALGVRETPVRWLWALWTMHFVLGDMEAARQVSTQALASSVDEASRCEAHHTMAGTLTSLGELEAAKDISPPPSTLTTSDRPSARPSDRTSASSRTPGTPTTCSCSATPTPRLAKQRAPSTLRGGWTIRTAWPLRWRTAR